MKHQPLLLFLYAPSKKSGTRVPFGFASFTSIFMNRCITHTVALCSVEFELHLVSRQQDELCRPTNFDFFL